jgi:hypothetical protein
VVLILKIIPSTTPKVAEWAMASPRKVILFHKTTHPIGHIDKAIAMPQIKA